MTRLPDGVSHAGDQPAIHPPPTASARFRAEVDEHFIRNYTAHVIEGGLFMGGLQFISFETVMPKIMKSLGGPSWLIGAMPAMMVLGFSLPPLLTAHWIERQRRVMPWLLLSGVFQRMIFLVTGLLLIYGAADFPGLVVAMVALTPMLSGFAAGLTLSAWLELVSKVIPAERRASSFALRHIISGLLGIAAGIGVEWTLEAYPGTTGYGILHLACFTLLLGSYIIFALIREVEMPPAPEEPKRDLRANLGAALREMWTTPRLFRFILCRLATCGIHAMLPFLSIYTLHVLGKPESFLGRLVIFQMVGMILGNLLFGWLGDRYGGKFVMLWTRVVLITLCISSLACHSAIGFYYIYLLLGVALTTANVGDQTLALEIVPQRRRPTFQSLFVTLTGPFVMLIGITSGILTQGGTYFTNAAVFSIIMLGISLALLLLIEEPRGQGHGAHAPEIAPPRVKKRRKSSHAKR